MMEARRLCETMKIAARVWGKLAVCLVFPKERVDGVKANCQFALPCSEENKCHFS
jgi:hypothetical protein